MLVLDEARYEIIDVAVGFELHQRRRDLQHGAEVEERHGAEPDVALLEDGFREGQELAVSRHIRRRQLADLPVEFGLIVGIVEGDAVFPAEAIEGIDGQQLTSSDMRWPAAVHSSSRQVGSVMTVGPPSKMKPSSS